jgi:hypothetical protein
MDEDTPSVRVDVESMATDTFGEVEDDDGDDEDNDLRGDNDEDDVGDEEKEEDTGAGLSIFLRTASNVNSINSWV